ncbi:exo-alpha-sialidase [Fulvivirga lutimaris]|uniref:exo-alpha-sialidase n=1 Tax=Fulvivirga lutimaris TaxID=1819566 RepID=UPI0012BBF8E8|nr:exo-alpha-sialidase [Fulvivirga lutimaris]MTI41424.1 exo-alpha-sialidase [Fulvivirga lutimaris]
MNRFLQSVIVLAQISIMACSPKESNETPERNIELSMNSLGEMKGALPHLYTDLDNQVYLSWVEKAEDSAVFQFAKLESDKWSTPKQIATGKNWFINWADYPMIATLHGQNFFSHHLAKSSEGTYSYDVTVNMSNEAGASWLPQFVLHDDGKQAEHGFVSVTPYEGNFLVVWLDGRNTVAPEGHQEMEHHGAMTLRAAVMDVSGTKLSEWELDDRVCDCCQTTVAVTDNGPVVIYRNRSEEEIRDMYVVRLVNDQWTLPQPLYNDNWKIPGCPVNGPRSSVVGNDVAVSWFTAFPEPQVKVIFSNNGGETFSEPVRLDQGKAIGRVDVVMIDKNKTFVSWMEGENIESAIVSAEGTVEQRFVIATSSTSRSSGFPQITSNGKDIIAAWSDTEGGVIKTGRISL